tara:strand:- start:3169 stop:3519 length:351 start_codon:yes stop_codon:yes gene_type:complete
MSNIQIVKLTTGEDIIGDVTESEIDGRGFLVIEKPAIIMMMPKPGSETEFGVGLAPYAPFAKDAKVPVFPAHVVSLYDPSKEMLNSYNKQFGSGLIQPDFINKKVLNEAKNNPKGN